MQIYVESWDGFGGFAVDIESLTGWTLEATIADVRAELLDAEYWARRHPDDIEQAELVRHLRAELRALRGQV